MSTTETATTTFFVDYTYRDQYGRSVVQLDRIHQDVATGQWVGRDRNLAVIVTLPRRTAHLRPEGENYLVNVRPLPESGEHRGTVTYHRTRNEALAYAAATVGL